MCINFRTVIICLLVVNIFIRVSLLHIKSCSNQCVLAIANYNYHIHVEGDLSLSKGDIVHILNSEDGDWWHAYSRRSKQKGFIPSNYVSEHLESYE